jgi:GT2 family glycosyltransferase
MEKYPKVAIIYLSYYSEPYLEDVILSLRDISYSKDKLEFVIVDNPHPEHGLSKKYIEERILPLSQNQLPHITYLPQEKNLGFCGGNNVGLTWAIEHGFDYAYLHNQDGFMDKECLQKLVEALENNPKIGCAQSVVALHPDTASAPP